MKAAGIIRIIVGLVIAVLLTAILVVLLTGNNIFSRLDDGDSWIGRVFDRATYYSGGIDEDSNAVIVSDEARVSASNIKKIKIDWVAGGISLRVGTGEDIVFSESSNRDLTERQRMRYTVSENGTLQIKYCENLENIFDWFSLDANMPAKSLVMEVPASLIGLLADLEIDTVSSNIDLSGVYGSMTDLSTVSGEIRCADIESADLYLSSTSGTIICENTTASDLEIDNVSGGIRLGGEFENIDIDTVSGSVQIAAANVPKSIDVDGVSGRITIALPETAGFTAQLDSVSGSLSCAFPGTLGSDLVVVGDGNADYSFDTVSGSVSIEKN